MTVKGVDISSIQGIVNFPALVAAGYQFVIHRCFIGNGGKDGLYDKNIAAAQAVGLKVAAYHFVYPLPTIPSQPTRDPKVQAHMHAAAAGNVPVVCCDLEWPYPQDWAHWGCTAKQIVQWTIDYLQEYERLTGIRPVVYTYPSFAQAIDLPEYAPDFAKTYQLWIASYTSTPAIPKPWTDWVMWQTSGGTSHLPNGGPPVDEDLAKDLSLWDVVVPPVAPLPPPPDPVGPLTPDLNTDVVTVSNPPATGTVILPTSVNPSVFSTIWATLSGLFKGKI